ncbi:hypothetical protein BBAL3_242 [Brevundimonas sp. BAL3]|uniref:hypothetical protein n=1 Tax=Brevundimonas sp. BAL3 TaxID=391600 RepID=UPI00017EB716|nr:hypothetical protein [Brevundimonas sp. BAL3]EDX79085.1 hypothetical protein BBAL3_242 [Brevundimonas sp. BAL3]
MFQWIRTRTERRRANQAAFAAEVVATADRTQAFYDSAERAWWRAQDEVLKAGGDRKAVRFWRAVVDELDTRIVRVSRPGPDTATRMWLRDQGR